MNSKNLYTLLVLSVVLIFTACKKDEDSPAKPVITIHELGSGHDHGNDHTAHVGGDLHMDVEIYAEGKVDYIQVKIHPEGEHHDEGEHDEWELDTTYTNYSGIINPEFHEHVEIGAEAEPGKYHFDFIVVDMVGNQSSAEADLDIVEE